MYVYVSVRATSIKDTSLNKTSIKNTVIMDGLNLAFTVRYSYIDLRVGFVLSGKKRLGILRYPYYTSMVSQAIALAAGVASPLLKLAAWYFDYNEDKEWPIQVQVLIWQAIVQIVVDVAVVLLEYFQVIKIVDPYADRQYEQLKDEQRQG